jgi:hypothetical protein
MGTIDCKALGVGKCVVSCKDDTSALTMLDNIPAICCWSGQKAQLMTSNSGLSQKEMEK